MPKTHLTKQERVSRSHSQAVIVENPSKTVYLCGVTNRDEHHDFVTDSFEAGARAAIERLRDAIEAAGGTLQDIVTMTVYLTDPRWGDEFVRVRAEYFEENSYPASALIVVPYLAHPELLLEIQAIGAID